MKRLTVSLFAVALAAGALTGGCVSKQEYDEALAACRRANDQLLECQQSLRNVRTEREDLTNRLEEVQALLRAREDLLAQYEGENELLQQRLTEIQQRLQRLAQIQPQPGQLGPLPEAVDRALRDFARQHPDLIVYMPEYGMVKFKADLTFELGSAAIQSEARDALSEFTEVLNSEAARRFHVYVAGHTDDVPIRKKETRVRHPNNWYLSVHRAVAVQEVLEEAGLSPDRLGVMGFSKYHPIAPNAPDEKGNRLNRRVELWIVPPDEFLAPPQPTAQTAEETAAEK